MPEEEGPAKQSGGPPDSLAINASFEEAVRLAMQVKKPEGGFPDFKTRDRKKKDPGAR